MKFFKKRALREQERRESLEDPQTQELIRILREQIKTRVSTASILTILSKGLPIWHNGSTRNKDISVAISYFPKILSVPPAGPMNRKEAQLYLNAFQLEFWKECMHVEFPQLEEMRESINSFIRVGEDMNQRSEEYKDLCKEMIESIRYCIGEEPHEIREILPEEIEIQDVKLGCSTITEFSN